MGNDSLIRSMFVLHSEIMKPLHTHLLLPGDFVIHILVLIESEVSANPSRSIHTDASRTWTPVEIEHFGVSEHLIFWAIPLRDALDLVSILRMIRGKELPGWLLKDRLRGPRGVLVFTFQTDILPVFRIEYLDIGCPFSHSYAGLSVPKTVIHLKCLSKTDIFSKIIEFLI